MPFYFTLQRGVSVVLLLHNCHSQHTSKWGVNVTSVVVLACSLLLLRYIPIDPTILLFHLILFVNFKTGYTLEQNTQCLAYLSLVCL